MIVKENQQWHILKTESFIDGKGVKLESSDK